MDILLQTIRSDKFRQMFHNAIMDIHNNRREALIKARKTNPSANFLSDPIGRLGDSGSLNYGFMSDEYLLVLMKKSNLPAMERKWISDFMTSLFLQTLQLLQKEKELEEAPVEIPVKTKKVNKPKKIKVL